ncbi:type II toxin-antitoxin system HicB family antitoxin [Halobacteriaceae archaeon SHR40]|uniref:type II toxin-antitoxin system HicB family antitoxin n=1 Tax=Halovenus amylolytica TaxID=2500550 RepID=UPI000FE2A450
MAKSDTPDDCQQIELLENPSGSWTATDQRTGVASQGETRTKALENLDEALALYRGETGHEPTDEELRELGVDPEIARSQGGELPDVLE